MAASADQCQQVVCAKTDIDFQHVADQLRAELEPSGTHVDLLGFMCVS